VRKTLIFDIESHGAHLQYSMPPSRFVRLIGYRWAGHETVLTTDLDELVDRIRRARWIIGHNIHAFDLPNVFGHRSNEPLELAMAGRVYDTWTHAVLVNPAPYQYTNRFGVLAKADKPEALRKWFSLDEQAHQLGVPGKTHDLKELAYEFGDPDLPKKERIADGFGRIPVDDPRYQDYLRGDVEASERVGQALLKLGPLNKYAMREQEIGARAAVISSNGFRVDRERAEARVAELAARREQILDELVERYELPTAGASPWDTTAGKTAIMAALADHGIRPSEAWPKTPVWDKRDEKRREALEKAAALRTKVNDWDAERVHPETKPRRVATLERWIARAEAEAEAIEAQPLPPHFGLSFGGDELVALTKDTPAADLGRALAELKGQRSLAQLALDSTHPDGFAHPEITMLQKSGRWSTTNPGLTVWTSRGEGAVEKSYFVPDGPNDVLLEFDYSNADARIVAALSGDKRYAERFEPGADGHLINAWAAWGKDTVGTDKDDPKTAHYRQLAKPGGHGWGYRIGSKKLAATWGLPIAEAARFLKRMNEAFHVVVAWQDRSVAYATRHGYVVNPWGRHMPVEHDRAYTQAPALLGQSGTREIVCDAILRLPVHILRRLKTQIHDALVFSVPKRHWEQCRDEIIGLMTAELSPEGGQRIAFPVDCGPPGANWFEAGH
jgi:DNA polymerase family A